MSASYALPFFVTLRRRACLALERLVAVMSEKPATSSALSCRSLTSPAENAIGNITASAPEDAPAARPQLGLAQAECERPKRCPISCSAMDLTSKRLETPASDVDHVTRN